MNKREAVRACKRLWLGENGIRKSGLSKEDFLETPEGEKWLAKDYESACPCYDDRIISNIHKSYIKEKAMIKEGDKLLAKLRGLCEVCGADKQNYLDTMGEPCFHGHVELNNLEQLGREMVREVDKASIIFEEVDKMFRLTLWRLQNDKTT